MSRLFWQKTTSARPRWRRPGSRRPAARLPPLTPEGLLERDRLTVVGLQAGGLVEHEDVVAGRPVDIAAGEQAAAEALGISAALGRWRRSWPVFASNDQTRLPVAMSRPWATPSRWVISPPSWRLDFQASRPVAASKA